MDSKEHLSRVSTIGRMSSKKSLRPDTMHHPELANSVMITIRQVSKLREMRIIELSVVAEYRRMIIGESESYVLDKDDDGVNMEFRFTLPNKEMNPKFWKDICGHQILLTFYKVVKPFTPAVSITTLQTIMSSTPKLSRDSKGSKKKATSVTLNISQVKKKEVKIKEEVKKKTFAGSKTSRIAKNSKSSLLDNKRCSTLKKTSPFSPDILGRCNIDLLPILQGQNPYNITVKIQQEKIVLGHDMITYDNLPEVQIEIKSERDIPLQERYNILYVTMEAVYNINDNMENLQAAISLPKVDSQPTPPAHPPPLNSSDCQETTPLYFKEEDNKGKRNKNPTGLFTSNLPKVKNDIGKGDDGKNDDGIEPIPTIPAIPPPPENSIPFIFKHGTRNDKESFLTKKKWESFTEFQGRAAFSPYDLEPTICDIRNPLHLDLETIYGKIPRIEWNCVYRNWMTVEEHKPFIRDLKYKKYPIEFMGQSDNPNGTDWHAMAIPDLKALTWPGVTRVRVATPLYVCDPELIKLHCGLHNSLLEESEENSADEEPELGNGSPRKKMGASKSKGLNKSSKKGTNDIKEKPKSFSKPPEEPPRLKQLFNQEGNPMFVIIQLQLKDPLIPLRPLEQLEREIDHMIPVRKELPKLLMDAQTAELLYRQAIQGSIDSVLKDYNALTKSQGYKSLQTMSFSDYVFQILQHLKLTGTYQHIKSMLVQRVAHLVHQKFMVGTKIETDNDYEMLMAEVYTYITREAHCVINTELALDIGLKINCDYGVTSEHIWQFAKEAEAIGDKERAKLLHLERITRGKGDADRWFDYAVYLAANKELEKATICTLEALSLDSRHRLSLLLHSILLVRQDTYCSMRDAENILLGLTTFYPLFTEAWVALHLLYLKTGDYAGADATLQYGIECQGNKEAASLPTEMQGRDYFYWTWIADEPDELFIQAAVFFLKFNICDFAELSLTEYINHGGLKDDKYYYLLGVHHFMMKRYEDAITHIQSAINIRQGDYQLCSMLGHCYYAVGQPKAAERNYDFVVNSIDRPNNISLVYHNMAQILFYRNNPARARTLYFTSVKYFPTPASWLGVGIASYKIRDFLTAEKAIREATTLDRNLARGWGYLALINLNLSRYNEFVQCYRIAKRTNLTDPCILEEIEFVRQQKNFPDPGCLCHASNSCDNSINYNLFKPEKK